MSSVGLMNISLTIIVVFECRGFRKTCIHFFVYFRIDTVIKTKVITYGEFDLFIKLLNFKERLDILRHHQKCFVILITILVFFERSLQRHTLAKFHNHGLTDSGFMIFGGF